MSDNKIIFANKNVLSGVPEGLDASFLVEKIRTDSVSIIHIARDDTRASALKAAVNFFDPTVRILDFPAWDCLPYDRVSPNKEISCLRMSALTSLILDQPKVDLLITTANAVSQRVPPREFIKTSSLVLQVGKSYNREQLISTLIDMGYLHSSTVTEKGEFAVRGGIVDIFPPSMEAPTRLDFFGDQLDQSKFFDVESQLSKESINKILLCPVSEFVLNDKHMQYFRRSYRHTFGSNGLNDPLYTSVSSGRPYLGYEHWGAMFYPKMDTLLDYVSKDTPLSMDYGVDQDIWNRWGTVNEQFDSRCTDLEGASSFKTKHKPLNPNLLYISSQEWTDLTKKREVFLFFPMKMPTGANARYIGGLIGRNFNIERQEKDNTLFKNLLIHLRAKMQEGVTVIACYSEGSRNRMQSMLSDHGFFNHTQISCLSDLNCSSDMIGMTILPLEQGFESNGLSIITEKDILGERLVRQSLKKRKAKNFLRDISVLKVNDLVVHVEHGLGKYEGLEKIKTLGVVREYLTLQYSGNDKLLLPVENIELLSRFGQDEAELDKLGSISWQSRKARLKKRLFDMADNLIKLAADRGLKKGLIFSPPEFLWDTFCARFPYQETDDQANAISDVLEDLNSGKPMDRLICGDVGFGKTEIALRATFVVASASKQVVIITPTTLLSRQHHSNFKERFKGLALKVEQLSRFVSKPHALAVKDGLKDGSIDIVIGTHALLSEKINFLRLGLVIIDEEQHFGVIHKERLKKLKTDVHVLTLTATPIPRTLQLALSGARDLSIIATPPVDRYVVRTYVSEFDGLTIRDALMREHFRGGQSFFVVPRVGDIDMIMCFLEEIVPDLKVGVAHGQMSSIKLDETMSAFYDHQYDILLATSIVESGLDIPTANTLIVYKADMFGLAQLYQIRGRVGRSKVRAYAYLITDNKKPITAQAEKRLKVLSNIESLGSGFSLASQDLDIRGAGNLLGDEQSGQIREVGFELYQSMLEEAITQIKSGQTANITEVQEAWSPRINLNVSVLIPDTFVTDLDVRLSLYRRLSDIRNSADMEAFAAELIDRFGDLPKEVLMLINIMKIKNKCLDAGIVKFEGGLRGATIKFYNDEFSKPEALMKYIQGQGDLIKIRESQLVIRRDWKKVSDKIKGAYVIVSDLARLANK
ncbi:MAG: transcription-repair coupling factor [Paracoccaceae bacterium]|nr:transcription-repair coupling factor [Paracoccaceae bacterium]